MSHSLATSSLLQAVGVHPGAAGTAGATAAVKWITKDGIGAFGRLLVGTVQTLSTLTAAHGSRSGPTTSCILALQTCCRCQDDVLHVCVCQLGQVPSLTQVGGRLGTIERDHGAHVFPDSNSRFEGENPQYLYTVRFAARELWGEEANPGDAVYLDLWEEYLDVA